MTARKTKDPVMTKRNCFFAFMDAMLSLNVALFINSAILIVAAASFYGTIELSDMRQAAVLLRSLFGNSASVIFGVALLFAGQSSTITGTIAGEMVMNGFIKMKVKPWIRRLMTRGLAILPAVGVILIFGDSSSSSLLIWSQVILSIQLPFAMIPLIRITSDKEMGQFVNKLVIKIVGWACVAFVVGLNIWLVIDTMRDNLEDAAWYLWALTIIGALLFLAFMGVVTFWRIKPVKSIQFHHSMKDVEVQSITPLSDESSSLLSSPSPI